MSKKALNTIEELLEKNRQLAVEAAEAAHNASLAGNTGGGGDGSVVTGDEEDETVVVDDDRSDL
jgi:hypothetical protein